MIRSNINTPYNMRNVRFDVKKGYAQATTHFLDFP